MPRPQSISKPRRPSNPIGDSVILGSSAQGLGRLVSNGFRTPKNEYEII